MALFAHFAVGGRSLRLRMPQGKLCDGGVESEDLCMLKYELHDVVLKWMTSVRANKFQMYASAVARSTPSVLPDPIQIQKFLFITGLVQVHITLPYSKLCYIYSGPLAHAGRSHSSCGCLGMRRATATFPYDRRIRGLSIHPN